MLSAQQHSQSHGKHSPGEKKQLLMAIAIIPERPEGLIQLGGKNHYSFFSLSEIFSYTLSEVGVE